MARIGFKKGKYNLMNFTTNKYEAIPTSGAVPAMTKVIDEKFSVEYYSGELYADDALAESDYSFKKGTLTITVADDDDALDAILFGNTMSTSTGTSGEVTKTTTDTAPYVGYGHIITKIVNGVYKYKVEFFPKVKFTSITADAKTKGDSIEFQTVSLEANVFPLDATFNGMSAGVWEKHKTFDSESDAVSYLEACLTPST